MTLLHILLGSNPTSSQRHIWVALGWISLRSEGMIIFCKIGWFSSSLSRESLSSLLTFLAYLCSDMLVISKAEFLCSLLLVSLYMRYVLRNINQSSLGSFWFSLLGQFLFSCRYNLKAVKLAFSLILRPKWLLMPRGIIIWLIYGLYPRWKIFVHTYLNLSTTFVRLDREVVRTGQNYKKRNRVD